MQTIFISIPILILTTITHGQEKTPDWFTKNMEQSIGVWVTDNSVYKNEKEPFDQYGMEWNWGIGKQSLTGTLYGLINGKKQGTFWEFRQYWDFEKNQAMIIQYSFDGTIGKGPMYIKKGDQIEMKQDFMSPKGHKSIHGHRSILNGNKFISNSYDISIDGNWKKRRSYTWYLTKNEDSIDLGTFSLALAVKDIHVSKGFYKKLGFEIVDGNLDQKWIILKNGHSKIGLFQGMFPTNTLSFTSTDVRKLYQHMKAKKIKIGMTKDMGTKNGPTSFMIVDPDNNPILIDQY